MTVDELAQEIRRVDGNHDLGAGALAEALMPFLAARPVSHEQGFSALQASPSVPGAATADSAGQVIEKLTRVRYTREDWHEPYGAIDLPCDPENDNATAHLINPDGPAAAALISVLRDEIALWLAGKLTREPMSNGQICIMHHPDDPNAKVRDSETGEVIFPAQRTKLKLVEQDK